MVVDIGGGTTDVAVISLSGIVYLALDPDRRRQDGRGDHQLREAQVQHAGRRAHGRAGEDDDRHGLGAHQGQSTMEIKGRDLVAGIPKVVVTTSDEIREALMEPIHSIVETVHLTLEKTPPELAADIIDRGIMLVGGGSLLTRPRPRAAPGDEAPDHAQRGSVHGRRARRRSGARRPRPAARGRDRLARATLRTAWEPLGSERETGRRDSTGRPVFVWPSASARGRRRRCAPIAPRPVAKQGLGPGSGIGFVAVSSSRIEELGGASGVPAAAGLGASRAPPEAHETVSAAPPAPGADSAPSRRKAEHHAARATQDASQAIVGASAPAGHRQRGRGSSRRR